MATKTKTKTTSKPARKGAHPAHPKCPHCGRALYKSATPTRVQKSDPYAYCRNCDCPCNTETPTPTSLKDSVAIVTKPVTEPVYEVDRTTAGPFSLRTAYDCLDAVERIFFTGDRHLSWFQIRRRAGISSVEVRDGIRLGLSRGDIRVYQVPELFGPTVYATLAEVNDKGFKFTEWRYAVR